MTVRNLALGAAILAAGVLATTASAQSVGGNSSTYGTITIAYEGPLTGDQAANGRDMLRGVQLAVREYNAAGGFYGRKVRLVKANDKANPGIAKSVARRVINGPAVAVVGPYNSSVGILNLPLYTRARVVPVQMTSTDDTTGKGVTVQPKNSQISPVEYDFIQTQWTPSKVSMLVDPSAYTQSMADRLQRSLEKKGVLVTQIPISEDQTDFTPQVNQALANNPTAVYLSTYYPQGAAIAKALEATAPGHPAKCFAGLANQDPAFISQAGISASRRCVFSGVPTPQQFPTAKAYVRNYTRAFRRAPGTWGTFTYDSAKILFRAWNRAGTAFDYSKVLAQLKKTTNYRGATGKITINRVGNRPNVPVSILNVDADGEFNVVYTNRRNK